MDTGEDMLPHGEQVFPRLLSHSSPVSLHDALYEWSRFERSTEGARLPLPALLPASPCFLSFSLPHSVHLRLSTVNIVHHSY